MPHLIELVKSHVIADPSGTVTARSVFTGIRPLDNFVGVFVALFTPSLAGHDHQASTMSIPGELGSAVSPDRLQIISFLADLASIDAIWMIESIRRGNYWTPPRLPYLFSGYYQLRGFGLVAPIYYFLNYIFVSPSRSWSADNRLTRTSFAQNLIPTIVLGYTVLAVGSFWTGNKLYTRQGWNFVWQLFPLWNQVFHKFLASCVTDRTEISNIDNSKTDLPYLRAAYAFFGTLSAASHLSIKHVSPVPICEVFFKGIRDHGHQLAACPKEWHVSYGTIICSALAVAVCGSCFIFGILRGKAS